MNMWIAASLAAGLAGCTFGTTFGPAEPLSFGPSPEPPDYVAAGPTSAPAPDAPAESTASYAEGGADAEGGAVTEGVPTACVQELGRDASHELPSATPIQPGSFVGCGKGEDQGDAFVLTAPATPSGGTLYEVEVQFATHGYWIYAYDDERAEILHELSEAPKRQLWIHAAPGRRAYVKIGPSSSSYRLTVKATPVEDPAEPNQDRAHATRLTLGKPVKGILSKTSGADLLADVFVFQAPRAGILNLAVVDLGPSIRGSATLSNADKERLDSGSSSNEGANLRMTARIPAAGTYYLTLGHAYSSLPAGASDDSPTHVLTPYTLTATLE